MFCDEVIVRRNDCDEVNATKCRATICAVTHFPCFIDKDHWPPSSPDLNPLDYCIWDELAHQVNWGAVTSKTTLIIEVKRAVRKVSLDVVFESCSSWPNRLYRLSQVKGIYLR
ncbi:unnamed protein product [Rotaria magnacalcarata]|uniref:Tc1-like transposase DDE domain-containing protein n=1 Tax=Rotaria magnacalcarata TaxID=392030 RepID=A0A816Z6H2_9BILA|nr:unnamed protein product [Rotaria magnacalcarata]CAF4353261.1 unnamed protein product [Rotaria magnacalcarata]